MLTVTAMMVVLKLSSNQKGNQTFLNVKIPETLINQGFQGCWITGVIGQNVLMANPSHQTFYPHYVSRSKQLHHPRLKDSVPIDSSHSFADK